MMTNNLIQLSSLALVASPALAPQKNNPLLFLKNHPKNISLRNQCCSVAPISCADNSSSVSQVYLKIDDDDEKFSTACLRRGETMIPKHMAICLDGNRRWLKFHGLDLDYRPFFQANMRFIEYCLKWGVGAATNYIYGLGNMKRRTKEASDLFIQQFERFLEGLVNFTRKGVKVSVIGEKWMLPESCQATIKRVEEATANNTNLDLMLPICYTSQNDIVETTKKIIKKVKEGKIEIEDVNEDLIEQHLSICSSQPPLDLLIRTGSDLRVGMLLAWEAPHTELYFTDFQAPDLDEDVFVDALRSFQQRYRMFGK